MEFPSRKAQNHTEKLPANKKCMMHVWYTVVSFLTLQ